MMQLIRVYESIVKINVPDSWKDAKDEKIKK